jgi:hypothetical protein
MVNAVVSGGEIRPLETLPPEWKEGQRLRVELDEDEREMSVEEIERDFAILEAMCANRDPADEERLKRALDEAKCLAKEQVRREMGLDSETQT